MLIKEYILGYSKHLKHIAIAKHATKAGKLRMPGKKVILAIVGVIAFFGLFFIIGIIALIIWIAGLINPDTVTETVNSVQQTAQQVTGITSPEEFILGGGQVDTQALEQQIKSLPPEQAQLWAESFNTQIDELLQQGKIIESQANELRSLLP